MTSTQKFFTACLVSTLFFSCTKDRTNEFSYEHINGGRYLETTKDNLIKLYALDKHELTQLLEDLAYHVQDKFIDENEVGYFLNKDTIAGALQLVNLVEEPTKILKITWASLDKKDRFAQFIEGVAQSENDLKYASEDTFILRENGDQYMASIQDVVVGRVISILKME